VFTTETGTFNNRFQIKYTSNLAVDNPDFSLNTVLVANDSNNIYVKSSAKELKSVEIYDVRGRLILSKDNINNFNVTFANIGIAHQVLIVHITSVDGKKVSKKIIL
jgi:hypothetical protein